MKFNQENILKIFSYSITLISMFLLIYTYAFIVPSERAILEDCNAKILCENNMLKGSICDKYKVSFNISNFSRD